ncbi:hypothetical protein, variant [Capsaspora owczarzaki ATCC 30864]|uniref:hypothetical protein, variant n=1 Tax=Capsaspora owczarzaki (strain ATCC 30864) TaxID=595528 RepID=UPI0001FE457D|nr:hypothetical protein, variant [Capsaspora owczarzaki ATCC 30864]|eukprot:XP_011270366.1 hypothetical protein, variant [Capsaspora owczarzaki ATCC 30864]
MPKDQVIFLTKEEEAAQPKEAIQPDNGDFRQAVGPNGEIDWDCPCIKPMTEGPCGLEFKDAFSCFVKSKEEIKGSDCIEAFRLMQTCMASHPEEYGGNKDADAEDEADINAAVLASQEAELDANPADLPVEEPAASQPQAIVASSIDESSSSSSSGWWFW